VPVPGLWLSQTQILDAVAAIDHLLVVNSRFWQWLLLPIGLAQVRKPKQPSSKA
jgi:hypothetical protein